MEETSRLTLNEPSHFIYQEPVASRGRRVCSRSGRWVGCDPGFALSLQLPEAGRRQRARWGRGHQGASHPGLAQKPRCLEPKGPSVVVHSLKCVNKRRRPRPKQRSKQRSQARPLSRGLPISPAAVVTGGACRALPPGEPRPRPLWCSLQCQSCPAPPLAQAGVIRPLRPRPFSVVPVKSKFLFLLALAEESLACCRPL